MHKYHAKRTSCGLHSHPSKKEAMVCIELRLRLKNDDIQVLEFQPRFPLKVNGLTVCTYVADFSYMDPDTAEHVILDVKGIQTPIYRLKKKLMQACYGITVRER